MSRLSKKFRTILDETFKNNLASGHSDAKTTDRNIQTFITVNTNEPLIIDLKKEVTFDRALLQENIANGQRVEEAKLEYWDGSVWKEVAHFATIGYKRLLRFKEISTSRLRLTIIKAKAATQMAELGFYKASKEE
jgi:alpha-L-fucosidase